MYILIYFTWYIFKFFRKAISDVIRTNIYDVAFFENSEPLRAIKYLRKNVYLGCLTWFLIRLHDFFRAAIKSTLQKKRQNKKLSINISESMDWFLYDKDLLHERVNQNKTMIRLSKAGTKGIPYQILLHKE